MKPKNSKTKIIGLTGGIASGKSTVARFMSEMGILVIDADAIARELSSPGGKAYEKLIQKFGTADRFELRKIVFQNPEARKQIEMLLHPLIAEESQARFQKIPPETPFAVYEAALLIEAGRAQEFQELIVVEAPLSNRLKWLMARDTETTQRLAEKMIASQISDEARRKVASIVIQNTGTLEDLRSEVKKVVERITAKR